MDGIPSAAVPGTTAEITDLDPFLDVEFGVAGLTDKGAKGDTANITLPAVNKVTVVTPPALVFNAGASTFSIPAGTPDGCYVYLRNGEQISA